MVIEIRRKSLRKKKEETKKKLSTNSEVREQRTQEHKKEEKKKKNLRQTVTFTQVVALRNWWDGQEPQLGALVVYEN